jgi:hypothetical protein
VAGYLLDSKWPYRSAINAVLGHRIPIKVSFVGGSDVRDGYDFAVRPLESHSDDEDGEQQYYNV